MWAQRIDGGVLADNVADSCSVTALLYAAAAYGHRIRHVDWREATDSVEKLNSHGFASYVEKIDLSVRVRIDDRDHGKGESTPEEVPWTECIEFFNRIDPLPSFANFDSKR